MINTQYIRLNMVPAGVLPVMHVSQFDIGRPLGVVVYDGSAEMDLDDYTVTIEATRTDGTPITAAVTTDGNIGAFVTTATMTNKDDLYPAQLVIVDGDSNRVASLSFMMRVVKAAMDENSEAIEEDAPLYQQYNAALQALIIAVRADLDAEVTARTNAVAAEESARIAADNTLQSNINAEATARAAQDGVLQAEIDQLVAPTGSAPSAAEVENARIGADGITYQTLGEAIRTNDTELKNDLEYATNVERIGLAKNGYYNLGSTITYVDTNGTPSLWGQGICVIIPCVPGDVFTITSTGTAAARNWAFLSDATSNNIISRKVDSTNQYVCVDEMVVAPNNAAYAVFNANKNYTVEVRKGKTPVLQIDEIRDEITNLGVPFATDSNYATIIPANSDLNSYQTPGNYKITTIAIAQTVTNIPEIVGGRLTVFTGATDANFAQLYIGSNSNTYIRVYSSNAWQDWNRIDNKALGNPIATNSTAATNVQSNDDFNNYTAPGNYKIATYAVATTISNIPVVLAGRLTVLTTSSNSSPVQIYIANNAACYIRIKVGDEWRAWRWMTDEATAFVLSTLYTTTIADNTDIDTLQTLGNYKVTSIASASTMSNLPEVQGGRLTVLTLGVTAGIHQWYISQSNNWYVRELISGNWSNWKKFTDESYVDRIAESSSENLTATKSAYNMFKVLANQSNYNIGFANAFVPITLKSYLGNNQNVHPKVLYFESGFGGHKYWMGYTPYPYSNDDVENPCVAYSDDGINFTNINGNPLDNPGGDGYDSDIHLVYRNDTGTLEAWFRYVGDASLEVREETIYRRTTTDGVTWTAKEELYSNESGVISKLLSPSIEWDGTNYCIWVVRDGVAIDYYTAPGANPTSWTLVRSITLTFVDDGLTVKAWHMDAIKDGNQYILLIMCRNGTGIANNRCSLFITTSNDNINYSNPVKVVGGADSWDRYMYRSSIVKVGDKYRIYYSAGSGGTTTIYNGAVWGIGITESDSLNGFVGLYY